MAVAGVQNGGMPDMHGMVNGTGMGLPGGGFGMGGMHQGSSEVPSLYIAETFQRAKMFAAALVGMLAYDHLITFGMEVEGVWRRKLSVVSVLFLLNRYLPLALYMAVIIFLSDPGVSFSFCAHAFSVFPTFMVIVSEAVIGVLLMLRTKAIWGGETNFKWVVIVIILFVVQFGCSVWAAAGLQTSGPFTLYNVGCVPYFSNDSDMRLAFLWLANISFNVIIFLCTLKRTLSLRSSGPRAPLTTLLLRDGTMYFAVLMAAKLNNLIMLIFFPYWNTINWAFNHVFDVILTSRLLLKLRQEGNIMRESMVDLSDKAYGNQRPYFDHQALEDEILLIGHDDCRHIRLGCPWNGPCNDLEASFETMVQALQVMLGEEGFTRAMLGENGGSVPAKLTIPAPVYSPTRQRFSVWPPADRRYSV